MLFNIPIQGASHSSGTVTVFIRPVNDDFQLSEELLRLESIHETTKGSDLSETLK
jgi:hypothetical protein